MKKEKIVGIYWDKFKMANGATNVWRGSTQLYRSEINVKTNKGKIITLPRGEVLKACNRSKYTDAFVYDMLAPALMNATVSVLAKGGEYAIKEIGSLIKKMLNSK